jgi:hypothetical protein
VPRSPKFPQLVDNGNRKVVNKAVEQAESKNERTECGQWDIVSGQFDALETIYFLETG